MLLRIPNYYTQFECIADKCKDCCCIGWEITIDEDTYDYYQQISGEFGKLIRKNISKQPDSKFILKNKRCPFLNQKNLCDICIVLGEEALCETCTEYPRIILEYGSVREKCLSLSCEEAGRLIIENPEKFEFEEFEMPEEYAGDAKYEKDTEYEEFDSDVLQYEYEPEYKQEYEHEESAATVDSENPSSTEIKFYETVRNQAIAILQTREVPLLYRIEQLLLFSHEIQQMIDKKSENNPEEKQEKNPGKKLFRIISQYCEKELLHRFHLEESTTKKKYEKANDESRRKELLNERLVAFRQMESFDSEWNEIMKSIIQLFDREGLDAQKEFNQFNKNQEYEYEHLLVYFLFRYGMMAVYDHKFDGKVKFAVISFLMIRDMDVTFFIQNSHTFTTQNRIDHARIYSKQMEHAQELIDYLEKEIKTREAFSTEALRDAVRMLRE